MTFPEHTHSLTGNRRIFRVVPEATVITPYLLKVYNFLPAFLEYKLCGGGGWPYPKTPTLFHNISQVYNPIVRKFSE